MAQVASRKVVVAAGLLVVGLAILFTVGLQSEGSLVYYLTVSEFLDPARDAAGGGNFRVNGNVVEGSIVKLPGVIGARFRMTDGTRELPVVYGKETPDTFVDGAEVVVEGSIGLDGVFQAVTLLAKCPSKYEAANRDTGNYKPVGEPAAPGSAPQ
jgi:cytochrome c-type biogenesis protein CcmE